MTSWNLDPGNATTNILVGLGSDTKSIVYLDDSANKMCDNSTPTSRTVNYQDIENIGQSSGEIARGKTNGERTAIRKPNDLVC
uniref:Lipoprotein n=1 Tax=Schistosoma mansoni TaxID=6183 RepID=A0A5K4F5W7_SCHMA